MAEVPNPSLGNVLVRRAEGEKCLRCWRVLPEVTAPKFLCNRCDAAVRAFDAAAADGADAPTKDAPMGVRRD
jgi:hypothetical protein